MNASQPATVVLDRPRPAAWAPLVSAGPAANRRSIPSMDGDRLVSPPVGASHAWADVIRRATRVAATEATTCLQGESGTGKEVVARFIHQRSPRWRGPF